MTRTIVRGLLLPALLILALGLLTPVRALAPVTDATKITVYVTKTGSKYHRSGCRYLRQSKIKTTLARAKADGYDPCSVCDPPE